MSVNGIRIAHLTNRFRLIDGQWYRDAWAMNADGSLRPVSVLRDLVDAK